MTPAYALRSVCSLLVCMGLCMDGGMARAQSDTPDPAAQKRPAAPIPPLRAGNLPGTAPGSGGILRILAQHGEVHINKGGRESAPEPLLPTAVLSQRDELSTGQGAIELASPAGIDLRLGSDSLLVLLGSNAVYLARGELTVSTHPGPGKSPPGLAVATPCGRVPLKVRKGRVRVDGNAAIVSVYDGFAFLGGYPPAGITVTPGHSNRCTKGEPFPAARPLLPAPLWAGDDELFLVGDGGSPTEVTLKWQLVAAAMRYRMDLFRIEGEAEVPVSSSEVPATRPQIDLRELEVGSYVARLYAIDENGALGEESLPHRFLLMRIGGLGMDGTIRTEAGSMPRVSGPPGVAMVVLLDGSAPVAEAPAPGTHKLRVMAGGLSAEAPMVVSTKSPPLQSAEVHSETPSHGEEAAEPVAPTPPVQPPQAPPVVERPQEPPAPEGQPLPEKDSETSAPPLDDVLLGGVSEVPFDGIRSPWAKSYAGARIESTVSGSLRFVAVGRFAMRNGFGFDVSAALLRAALASSPDGASAVGFGNINAGVRTPALRRSYLALQGLVGLVIPISTSFLDKSIEVDAQYAGPDGSVLKAYDPERRGGGWRIEPALLLGIRKRHITISTMQGLSLRVAPDLGVAYAGGLIFQAEILAALRFISFAAWQVNYLGIKVNPGDETPDAGGALGAGFEALIPGGRLGTIRLAILGRAGLGNAGAAIYGRGAVGLKLGYSFY